MVFDILPAQRAFYDGHQLPVSSISLANSKASGAQAFSFDVVSGSGDKTIILCSSEISSKSRGAYVLLVLLLLLAAILAYHHPHSNSLLRAYFDEYIHW